MPRVSGRRTRSLISTARPRFTIGAGIGLLVSCARIDAAAASANSTTTEEIRSKPRMCSSALQSESLPWAGWAGKAGERETSLSSQPILEERDKRRVSSIRGLHVRHVTEAGQQVQMTVAIRNRRGDELHALLEDRRRAGEAVLGAAEHQRRRLDVAPVV